MFRRRQTMLRHLLHPGAARGGLLVRERVQEVLHRAATCRGAVVPPLSPRRSPLGLGRRAFCHGRQRSRSLGWGDRGSHATSTSTNSSEITLSSPRSTPRNSLWTTMHLLP